MTPPPAAPAANAHPVPEWQLWLEAGLRRLGTAEPWLALAFLCLNFALGIFWFVLLVTFLAVGVGTAITLIGLPILAATVFLWVGGARAERWRIGLFTGRAIPSPYRPLPGGSFFRRARALAGDPAVWRDLVYLVLLFPLGIAEFVVACLCLAAPVAFVTIPFYYWAVPGGVAIFGSNGRRGPSGFVVDTWWESLLVAALGIVLAAVGGWVVTWAARGHVALARLLLAPSGDARLAARVETLTRSRSAAVDAQLAERRRIERDLHDGAQQRLVALAMDLGMAKEKLKTDPEGGRALVEASHEEAKRVLADLRDLVRGIHPAVLTDRGLDAAISAIAGRSPVPVRVDVRLGKRPSEAVEAAAYFVVVEALANVAKHGAARDVLVAIRREGEGMVDDRLVVDVVDDGLGGADPSKGTGLTGLRDRLAPFDGRLSIDSPVGGPTWLMAEIPWEAAAVAAPPAPDSGTLSWGENENVTAATAAGMDPTAEGEGLVTSRRERIERPSSSPQDWGAGGAAPGAERQTGRVGRP